MTPSDPPPRGEDALDSLPPVLAQAWGLSRAGSRGPKAELSVEAIVAEAVRVADADGLEAVTMSRIARGLGFTTMSLYRHVASKDDLLQLMSDAAFDIDIPAQSDPPPSWRETLAAWTRETRRHYLRHPWKLDLPVIGPPSLPNTMQIADWALRGMRDLPLSDAERVSLLLTLSSLAHSFARMDVQLRHAAEELGAEATVGVGLDIALAQLIDPSESPDIHRLITAGAYFGTTDTLASGAAEDPTQEEAPVIAEFEYALALVLDGLAAQLPS